MVQIVTMQGTWSIEGDSLVKNYDINKCKMELDDKDVTYLSEYADQIAVMKDELCGEKGKQGLMNQLAQNKRKAQGTNIDKTGTRLELTEPGSHAVHYIRK